MNTYFQDAFEEFRKAGQHMVDAHQAFIRGVEHVLHAKNEHEDLRETVRRLESTVLDLVVEVRALRNGQKD